MRYEGIKEINEMECLTTQVYISNYGLIKQMLNSPRAMINEYTDEEAVTEHLLDDSSVYSQGLDDVSFNIQETKSMGPLVSTEEVKIEEVKTEEVKKTEEEVKK